MNNSIVFHHAGERWRLAMCRRGVRTGEPPAAQAFRDGRRDGASDEIRARVFAGVFAEGKAGFLPLAVDAGAAGGRRAQGEL